MPCCSFPNRGVLRVAGPEAAAFLDNLLTVDVGALELGKARFGALLSPQGKIIADMVISRDGEAFRLDCPGALRADLIKRLTLYRLRAKVEIMDQTDEMVVLAGWAVPPSVDLNAFPDPRHGGLGWRALVARDAVPVTDATPEAYQAHRIALGIPEGGRDFAYGDAFPHEALMDRLNGVDFAKGCYVGQEVVSRMQHRGTARTRCIPVLFVDGIAPPEGTEAVAGDRVIGHVGSSAPGGRAIAMLRLDRLAEAVAETVTLTAGSLTFLPESRDFLGFEVPGAA